MSDNKLLETYNNGYNRILDVLYNIPTEAIDYKPAPDKWSIREVIIHLTDCEANGFVRIKKALAENGEPVTPYDQDKWAAHLHYDSQSIDENLELFKMLRNLLTKLLYQIQDDEWHNYMAHPERGNITVKDFIDEMNEHVETHIKQILRNFDSWKS
ncbi:MAG: DinB family protein [Ignavibacteria bacterium]